MTGLQAQSFFGGFFNFALVDQNIDCHASCCLSHSFVIRPGFDTTLRIEMMKIIRINSFFALFSLKEKHLSTIYHSMKNLAMIYFNLPD
ncbi:MAG: hypothetical protein WC856_27505 [Methylococcaceae bacterium]